MVNQQLLEYVKTQLKNGIKKEDLIAAIRKSGWQERAIQEVFWDIEKPAAAAAPVVAARPAPVQQPVAARPAVVTPIAQPAVVSAPQLVKPVAAAPVAAPVVSQPVSQPRPILVQVKPQQPQPLPVAQPVAQPVQVNAPAPLRPAAILQQQPAPQIVPIQQPVQQAQPAPVRQPVAFQQPAAFQPAPIQQAPIQQVNLSRPAAPVAAPTYVATPAPQPRPVPITRPAPAPLQNPLAAAPSPSRPITANAASIRPTMPASNPSLTTSGAFQGMRSAQNAAVFNQPMPAVRPVGSVQQGQRAQKSHGFLLGFVAVLFLLGITAAGIYFVFPDTFENTLKTVEGFTQSFKMEETPDEALNGLWKAAAGVKTGTFAVALKAESMKGEDSTEQNLLLDVNSKGSFDFSDANKPQIAQTLTLDASGPQGASTTTQRWTATIDSVSLEKTIYLNFRALDIPLPLSLKEKGWIQFDFSDATATRNLSGSDLASIRQALFAGNIFTVAEAYPDESVNSIIIHHYALTVNKQNLKAVVWKIADILQANPTDEEKAQFESDLANQSFPPVEVWFDAGDYLPRRIEIKNLGIDEVQSGTSVSLIATFDHLNQPVTIAPPDNAVPFESIVKEVTAALHPAPAAKPSSSPAKPAVKPATKK